MGGGSESKRSMGMEGIKEKYSITVERIILKSNTSHREIH